MTEKEMFIMLIGVCWTEMYI